jgi:tagaturonate reductase
VKPTWPADEYDRSVLPERVLQFGTGMLLRALSVTAVDAANRAGAFNGRIVVVQSTQTGCAAALNRQQGLFTLVERGVEQGEPIQRTRLIGSISRALVAATEWTAVRDVVARPQLRVIVSNVTEAGFRLDDREPAFDAEPRAAPRSFPAKLTDLLFTRFAHLPDGPSVFVIPTELVADNGARLAGMVDQLAGRVPDAAPFRAWIARQVHFCSSLVDRITTGAPPPAIRAAIESHLGYRDALLTMTEPHSLWAIEGDPAALRTAFPVDAASGGTVILAADIACYRDRKLRMLNGAHTALAPLALIAGVRTVREATEHAQLGPFLRQLLLEEIAPSMSVPPGVARSYASSVIDRFRNPWLDHEWRVIATNQTAKFRVRVVPSILEFGRKRGAVPRGLALALAATLRFARTRASSTDGEGWWRGDASGIVDVDRSLIDSHWRTVDPDAVVDPVPEPILARFAERALADAAIWGSDLRALRGVVAAVTRALAMLEHAGVSEALAAAHGTDRPS